MYKLQSLSDKLMNELKGFADKSAYSPSDIETIRNLISSVNKICEYTDAKAEKEEYSNRMSYDNAYNSYDGGSYARGRMRAKRDSMGRYSREYGYSRTDEIAGKLYEAMQEAPEHLKHEIKAMIDKLEHN